MHSYGIQPWSLPDAVDVNVTPDKRQIFVQNEKLLLATLKVGFFFFQN